MIDNLKTFIVALLAIGAYHYRSEFGIIDQYHSSSVNTQNPVLVSKFGQYYKKDQGVEYENPNHKPRKFYYEDYEKYFNVFVTHRQITDESIKGFLDAHDIYQEEVYLNDKERFDELSENYGLYIEKGNQNDRRIYIAYAGHQKHYGVFAEVDIPRGSFIGEYTGVLTNNTANTDYAWDYLSNIKDENNQPLDLMIDGRIIGNAMRFVNHNDDPSTDAMEVPWKNRWHRIYVATRDIHEGEELTVSYGQAYWETREGKV